MSINSIKLTVLFEEQFWVGIFERTCQEQYSVARVVFGGEPSEPELYEFLLDFGNKINFSSPLKDVVSPVRKINPKRLKREVKRSLEKYAPISKAQDSLRIELEKNKKIRKQQSKADREERKQRLFDMKQKKKKKKLRGH